MSAKGEKLYVTNHQMNITLFEHAHFIKPQTLNLKPSHLLHNKERFECIKVNVGMHGDQRHLVGTNSWTNIFHKALKP
jgi:hypothetical protein